MWNNGSARNQGSPGVDGMTIADAKTYLREHWPSIRSQLLDGTYQPQPVKRVEIPKPAWRALSVLWAWSRRRADWRLLSTSRSRISGKRGQTFQG
jgi:retron-type reverse transcriptase